MRHVAVDTETTGLGTGHRIVGLSAVEFNPESGAAIKTFSTWLNPQREVDPEASKVHGKTLETLKEEPLFSEVADEFVGFIRGARVVAHNATFDMGMLNTELGLLGRPLAETFCEEVVDTFEMARKCVFTKEHNLDALLKYFGLSSKERELHTAELDAVLLASVYPHLIARYEQVMTAFKLLAPQRPLKGNTQGMSLEDAVGEYLVLSGICGYFNGLKDSVWEVIGKKYEEGETAAGGFVVKKSVIEGIEWKKVQSSLLKGVDLTPYKKTTYRMTLEKAKP
jgi:DNA polymerase-3 subunit epsilon